MNAALVTVGWLGLALAAIALWSGLAWHPKRGTPCCRRCSYDLTGVPTLTCPECGKVHETAGSLLRRRARWRRICTGALCLVVGIAGLLTPKALRDGPLSLVPRPVLILLIPTVQSRYEGVGKEIARRHLSAFWSPRDLTILDEWLIRRTAARTLRGASSPEAKALASHLLVLQDVARLEDSTLKLLAPMALAETAKVYGTADRFEQSYSTTVYREADNSVITRFRSSVRFSRSPQLLNARWEELKEDGSATGNSAEITWD